MHAAVVIALLLAWAWQRAWRRVRVLERRELRMLLGCSLLASQRGLRRDASLLAREALHRACDRGDVSHEGLAHECLGDIAQVRGDAARARHHWRMAAALLQTWSCHHDAARVCAKLARVLAHSGQHAGAARWDRRAGNNRLSSHSQMPLRPANERLRAMP